MTRIPTLVSMALAAGAQLGAAAIAQDSLPDLRRRFEERYREIFTLKVEGRIGEAFTGYVEIVAAVAGDERIRKLVEAENRDRKAYYELLAEELKAQTDDEAKRQEITPGMVARRNAARNLENARPAEHFKMEDGVWIQKENQAAYERVLRLKRDGVVGESAEGYLAVRRDEGADPRLVEQENERRRAFYRRIAALRSVKPEEVAREYGRAHLKSARPGDWIQDATGAWTQAKEPGRRP